MELHLPIFMISLILFVGVTINYIHVSASTITPEMYWKNALPNTPMPIAIKNSLQSIGNNGKSSPFRASNFVYYRYLQAATRKEVDDHMKNYGETFMLEPHMVPGRILKMRLITHTDNKATFLPLKVSNSIPFSSDKLPKIFKQFSIDLKSKEAVAIESTLKGCEIVHEAGESKYCATSLETMISFVKSKLGVHVNTVSSTSTMKSTCDDSEKKAKYRITEVKKLVDYGSPTVVCHKEDYPYAVFYCHEIKMTAIYLVSMVGDGIDIKATAVCHKDTSEWNPEHLSFRLLKAKPGKTTAVCHFLGEVDVVWTKK